MMTEYEAAQLQRDMRHELGGSTAALAQCAAGLALIALIAAIGASSGSDTTGVDVAAAEAGASYEIRPEQE